MMVAHLDWAKYGRVIAIGYRRRVVTALEKGPMTPKQIADATSLHISHVSRFVKELEKNGVLEYLTPELRRGKLIDLTKDGKEIVRELKKSV
jgi:DNA-binding MarR family transcriptional regulator